jgi:hypothetical protein
MNNTYLAALLRPLGPSNSVIASPENSSPLVCWLLTASHEHPNLLPLEEEDWNSLLATAELELRRE